MAEPEKRKIITFGEKYLAENHPRMKFLVAYEKIRDIILTGEKLPDTRLVISKLEKLHSMMVSEERFLWP